MLQNLLSYPVLGIQFPRNLLSDRQFAGLPFPRVFIFHSGEIPDDLRLFLIEFLYLYGNLLQFLFRWLLRFFQEALLQILNLLLQKLLIMEKAYLLFQRFTIPLQFIPFLIQSLNPGNLLPILNTNIVDCFSQFRPDGRFVCRTDQLR